MPVTLNLSRALTYTKVQDAEIKPLLSDSLQLL